MRRFTELLLLVACTLPRFFVNGFEALQPLIKNNVLRADAMIRGLLDPRQFFCENSGYALCSNDNFCCPIDWVCCIGYGRCCEPATYCAIASNGDLAGCCPDGEVCFGSANNNPPPPTNNPPPPPPPPPPTTTALPPILTSTSTTTSTTLLGGPTQSFENQIIDVSVLDINWSVEWVSQTSSCDPSINSMITSTGNSSFTYSLSDVVINFGYSYYINVANSNTEWEVFVNGVSQNTYFSYTSGFTNCTYLQSNFIDTQLDITQNITVVVVGLEPESVSDSWSLEVNMLLIQVDDSTSGPSSTQNTVLPTNLPLFSAAGRAQPYRPLLVTGSILLAAVISILHL